MESFRQSGIHTKQAHVKIPEGLYEEEHGRKGFFGRVSHIYHTHPPVGWTDIQGGLRPHCLSQSFFDQQGDDPFVPLLHNSDLVISTAIFSRSPECYFRNGDWDELLFVHEGNGTLETIYGHLEYAPGDYIVLPKGTTYKFFVKTPGKMLKVEGASEFEDPSRGILGPNALYDQSAKTIPEAALGTEQASQYTILIKRKEGTTKVTYPWNPLDAKGWKGSVYPWKLSIYDYCPIMSHRYHIPPSGHTTFTAKNFVVCSFVERPLEDEKHGVLKVPFYHSNIDYDEVLFYHAGDFFSRDGITSGALTFHPHGIHHGPHPKAFEKGSSRQYTDEYAVMIDARNSLQMTEQFKNQEYRDYWKSWM